MDSKIAEVLTKLVLEDDEDDVVSEISPVFEAMFSTRWNQEEQDNNQLALVAQQEKIITLDDHVKFDQYVTFKLFMQILYGLRQLDSLNVDQATGVYFYSHKYEIKDVEDKIKNILNKRMESGISTHPFSVTELKDGVEFAQMYELDEFKKKLDQVKLAFDEENPFQFWDLAKRFEMVMLKQQVLDHLKTTKPKEDWAPDIFCAVIARLQADRENSKTVLKELKCKRAAKLSPLAVLHDDDNGWPLAIDSDC